MQFFRIKKVKDRNFKSLIFRERKRKYEKESDTYISKVKPVIIYGKAAAGKSKEISKLWEQKQEIWDEKNIASFGLAELILLLKYYIKI